MDDMARSLSPSGLRKVSSIFKGLSRSSSKSSLREPPKKLPALLQAIRRTRKMKKELEITLPSDKQWRLKNYFKLLDKQRQEKLQPKSMPSEEVDEDGGSWDPVLLAPEAKRARISGASSHHSEESIPTSQPTDIPWNSLDIAKAGKLLCKDRASVTFQDEDEMRRVFTLLYDVFRYKVILSQALNVTGFYEKYSYAKSTELETMVWLLFYDLHRRRFLPREHEDAAMCRRAFASIGLLQIEADLWFFRVRYCKKLNFRMFRFPPRLCKVKLAAALARHRIKNNALRLNQLLPYHLRDEKLVSVEDTPVTGWINTFKSSKKNICENVEALGLKLQNKHETVLTKYDFRFDHLCPKLLLCHPTQRADLAQSIIIKQYRVVLQDRAFCLGPAMTAKVLLDASLRGTVAQTHVNSPRSTAYLANILQDNEKIDKVIAFGAAERQLEYQMFLHELGVTNCEVYAQKFCDVHPEAAILENLVAVLATPPNSYTGVTDPVDLICSRGGDMTMLRALTQTEMNEDTMGFLAEQRGTLKYSMSLPQVQIIMYETHSVATEENIGMVKKVTEEMNTWATDKHAEEQRMLQEQEEAEERANKVFIPGQREKEPQEALDTALLPKNFEVPPCDLFELGVLPDLCQHGGECFADEGCFIARIQRKEIISLDAKYMIKIAEARGLFGAEPGQKKSSTARAQKKREDLMAMRSNSNSAKSKGRKSKLEVDRIAAPTQASLHRTRRDSVSSTSDHSCPRHQHHATETLNKVLEARRQLVRQWWREAYKLILRLIPNTEMTPRSKAAQGLPLLRLPRATKRKPFPMHKACIEFEARSDTGVLDEIIDNLPELRRNSC